MKLLREENREDDIKSIYDAYFAFAAMWAYGGSLDEENKPSFSKNWMQNSKTKFPEGGMCFDYFFDPLQLKWEHWDTRVTQFDPDFDGLYQNLVVPTAETTRQRFLLDIHVQAGRGILYVGSAGTGKTTIMKDYFSDVNPDHVQNAAINFNNYTDSKALQLVVESKVDKMGGKKYGAPPNTKLIYFMDDLNMPFVDKYGTQSPICLVRQILDHRILFDRDHLEEQKLLDDSVMFTACMNPKSGSFYVDPRLSRHFTLVSCLTTEKAILKSIYMPILTNHLSTFVKGVQDLGPAIVSATTVVFWQVAT